jgi:natural product precursor
MSKINLKSVNQILSEKEMKNVVGGASNEQTTLKNAVQPCPENGCSGPHGSSVPGGLCCLLPCFGALRQYGYGIVRGMTKCPW